MMHVTAFIDYGVAGIKDYFRRFGVPVLHPDWPRLAVTGDINSNRILARWSIHMPLKLIAFDIHTAVRVSRQ
jgi:hypothetical protein